MSCAAAMSAPRPGALREQAAAIAAGEADPGELLDASLARIEERNPEHQRDRRDLPRALAARCSTRPRGPALRASRS